MIVKILEFCFNKYYRPIILWTFTLILFVLFVENSNVLISNAVFYSFGIGLLGLLISAVYQIMKKRLFAFLLNAFLLIGTFFFIIMYITFGYIQNQGKPSHWADNLTIPDSILIEEPVDLKFDHERPDSFLTIVKNKIDFQLYNSFQPGLFEYDLWIGEIDQGKIHLKVYEITKNIALSVDELPQTTTIDVFNRTDSLIRFGTTNHFTIYEGDWGKPYAARFEVWYKPWNSKTEQKLIEKNYKIEGWMP